MQTNYKEIYDLYNMEVGKHTKNKYKVYRFNRFQTIYINNIVDIINSNSYSFMKYNIFMINNPKYRIIMSLNIKDKIINHYVARYILMPKLEKYLDDRNVATRKNKGRDYGIVLLKKYLEKFKYKKNCYALKIDISKFFYNIDHNILKNMLKKDLDNDEYKIMEVIIDSTNYDYINKKIKYLKEKELSNTTKRHKEIEEIPYYEKGKGLPIGNMTSQFLGIYYLNSLDHKIIHDLHLKYYVRYMDDFIILSDDLEDLKKKRDIIIKDLEEVYNLKINTKKTNIKSAKEGIMFCGYRFRIIDGKTVINVLGDTRRRVKRRIKEVKYLYQHDKISLQSAFFSMNTYYNCFKFGSRRKMQRLVEKYFFEALDDKKQI